MAVFEEFLEANRKFAAQFAQGNLPAPPARKVAVLTCMDARLDPAQILGLAPGDAHVIRNAGGRASDDALRSLVISQRLLGTTEIVVIHHTKCGMSTFSNDHLVSRIRDDLGADASGWNFLPFDDLERSVLDDVETLRRSELIPSDAVISGAVYDIDTGVLREIVGK